MEKINELGTLKERQKAEAVKRLIAIGVIQEVIESFIEEGTVYVSERQNAMFSAVLYYVSNYPELVAKVEAFEERHNALVYHVQLMHTEIGDMYSMLYVSKTEEEWSMDAEDIAVNTTYANVWNTIGIEEIGLIGFKPEMGGILRIW